MNDITEHKWSDEDFVHKIEATSESLKLWFGVYNGEYNTFNKDDSIAIAKHFKHYRDTEKLDFIAQQLQSWIDFSKQKDEDSHIIPPMWPTKCQLKNWIKVLSGNDD